MQITVNESENLFLELANGRKMRLPRTVVAEVTEGGVLTIVDGDLQTAVYPPAAWICLKKQDPAAVAAQVITKNGIPDTPEGLVD